MTSIMLWAAGAFLLGFALSLAHDSNQEGPPGTGGGIATFSLVVAVLGALCWRFA